MMRPLFWFGLLSLFCVVTSTKVKSFHRSKTKSKEKAVLFAYFSLIFKHKISPETLSDRLLCDEYTLVDKYREPGTNTQFVVYKTPSNHYVVSFRGTHFLSIRNIVTNLLFFKKQCIIGPRKCGHIHYGYQKAYSRLSDILIRSLQHAERISFTGHSLGGALAILASYDMLIRGLPVKNVYVYGAPRLGDDRFERIFHELQRHLNVDEERFIARSGRLVDAVPFIYTYSYPHNPMKYQNCDGLFCSRKRPSRIGLHRMQTYFDALKQNLPESTQCIEIDSHVD
jgi:hypothetical protein